MLCHNAARCTGPGVLLCTTVFHKAQKQRPVLTLRLDLTMIHLLRKASNVYFFATSITVQSVSLCCQVTAHNVIYLTNRLRVFVNKKEKKKSLFGGRVGCVICMCGLVVVVVPGSDMHTYIESIVFSYRHLAFTNHVQSPSRGTISKGRPVSWLCVGDLDSDLEPGSESDVVIFSAITQHFFFFCQND